MTVQLAAFYELAADIRYAFRSLRNPPSFAVMSITPFALKIGANAVTAVQRRGSAEKGGVRRREESVSDAEAAVGLSVRRNQSPNRKAVSASRLADWRSGRVKYLPCRDTALVPRRAFRPGEEHVAREVDCQRRMLPCAIAAGGSEDAREHSCRQINTAHVDLTFGFPSRVDGRRTFGERLRAHHACADVPLIHLCADERLGRVVRHQEVYITVHDFEGRSKQHEYRAAAVRERT